MSIIKSLIRWLNRKREQEQQELLELYRQRVCENYIHVPIPTDDQKKELIKMVEQLHTNKLFLFWFAQIKVDSIRDFTNGIDNSEFIRGKLAMLSEIQRRAANGQV